MPKISIIIVTYNSMKYLPDFLDRIFEQSYFKEKGLTPDIFIVDNSSADKTVKFIKDNFFTVHLLRNINNIGLCRAWNQAIKITSGEYILIMNPDVILHQDYLKETVKILNSDQSIASVGGKLYQLKISSWDGDNLLNLEKTNIIDSTGIQAFKNRRFIERGAGEIDHGQYNKKEQVFGVSGACAMYRRSALEQIKFESEYFDESFFMYKEDVDLAWRLRLSGWINYYTPQAIGYHHRRARSQGKVSDWNIIRHRRQKEDFVNFFSYRNHLLLLRKNSLKINVFKHFPFVFLYELKKFLYVLILENSIFRRTIRDLIKLRKIIKQKRRFNIRIKKVKPEEIQQWFN